ncbi:MAG: hypothetical protein Q4E53_04580 [Eubacteriales bacterium]|nr:hypothetical protein [Eubacteriales bacterium]
MDLMKSYSWPYNLNQLKRVLKELIVRTTTPYILYDDVNYILSTEAGKDHVLLDGYYGINTRKTLQEINRDVVTFVLEEEKE